MVRGCSAVAELEAASSPGGDLGDDPLDVRPARAIVLAQPLAGGPGSASGAQQGVVLVRVQDAAGSCGGALLSQRAAAASSPEDDGVLGGEMAGDAGRAGHGPSGRVDGEVTGGEAAFDGRQ